MSTHIQHLEKEKFYFITFTCYRWMPLIENSSVYNYFPFWFSKINDKDCQTSGFVIMPNHIHMLLYIYDGCKSINKVIGESKRFLAYEIIKRLKQKQEEKILILLQEGVQVNERTTGKKHQVFNLSFDAKPCESQKEIERVLDYMHHNPVSKKWNLANDYLKYPYSSARFYEKEEACAYLEDYRVILEKRNVI